VNYYYSEKEGEALEPYSKEDLVLLVINGDVSREALICPEGSN